MGPRGAGLSWGVMRPPTGLLLRASRACSWGADEGDCSGLCSRDGQHNLRRGQPRLPGIRAFVDSGARLPLEGGRLVVYAQPHEVYAAGAQTRSYRMPQTQRLQLQDGDSCTAHAFGMHNALSMAACKSLLLHNQCHSTARRLHHHILQSAAAKLCPAAARKVICRCCRSGACRATYCYLALSLS